MLCIQAPSVCLLPPLTRCGRYQPLSPRCGRYQPLTAPTGAWPLLRRARVKEPARLAEAGAGDPSRAVTLSRHGRRSRTPVPGPCGGPQAARPLPLAPLTFCLASLPPPPSLRMSRRRRAVAVSHPLARPAAGLTAGAQTVRRRARGRSRRGWRRQALATLPAATLSRHGRRPGSPVRAPRPPSPVLRVGASQ